MQPGPPVDWLLLRTTFPRPLRLWRYGGVRLLVVQGCATRASSKGGEELDCFLPATCGRSDQGPWSDFARFAGRLRLWGWAVRSRERRREAWTCGAGPVIVRWTQ